MKYHKAILGGTFDHFHKGHKKLLDTAFLSANDITIGLTTEKFYRHKLLSREIEPYARRADRLKEYLLNNGYDTQGKLIELTDLYGPALTEEHIDAIFVTEDTLPGAKKINAERKKIGFSQLAMEIVPFELAEDFLPITSERIRLGEINEEGRLYAAIFQNKPLLTLPQQLRERLRTPIGEIITNPHDIISRKTSCLITVGDIVTKDLLTRNTQPDISIIDLKTQRHEVTPNEKKILESLQTTSFTNNPGTINTEFSSLFSKVSKQVIATGEKQTILVRGEEDLLTLPAILLAPLNSLVVYGQKDVGAIAVSVTKEKKEEVSALLTQFE